MNQKQENMVNIIGCNKAEFQEIINKAVGNISLSSGSWYDPFIILDRQGILARYSSKGILEYKNKR